MKPGNARNNAILLNDLKNPSVALNCALVELFKNYSSSIELPDWVTEDKPSYTVNEIQGLVSELNDRPTNEEVNYLVENLEDLIGSMSSGYIGVDSLELPSSSDGGYSWLTEGTYTQEDGPNIIVNEGELVLASFDGLLWTVNQTINLPIAEANGAVAEGDVRAVSGDEVFNDLEEKGLNKISITQDPIWIYAVTINNRVAFGIKRADNTLWWKAGLSPELDFILNDLGNRIDGIESIKGFEEIEDLIYSYIIKDINDKIVFGIKKDGSVVGSLTNLINSLIKEVNDRIDDLELAMLVSTVILTVGDSLTAAGQYQAEIGEQLGADYTVINGGVGGENSRNIVARMGGLRSILTNPVTIPANGTEVQIGDITNSGLQTLDVDGVYYPLTWFRQGPTVSNNTINPLTIEGIECTLRWTGSAHNDPAGLYMLKRNVPTAEDYITKANTEVFVSSLKKYRRPRVLIAWLGQNGGYVDNDALVKQYKALVSIVQPDDFVVIGLHSGTAASRADLEKLMAQEFGNRFINWRKYASESALRDMGIAPTEADNTAMAVGSCPPSLLTDAVHLTTAAGRQLGKLIIQTLKNINSWPTIA